MSRSYPALRITSPRQVTDLADLVAAALDDFGLIAIQEDAAETSVTAFFAEANSRPAAAAALGAALGDVAIEELDVPDENWAERSQAGLKAVRVGLVTVAPPWDIPESGLDLTIVISPSMGFGTGHHATTQLCLRALQEVDLAARSVIDVGTGSGVLALAALRLGAARVLAIDSDPDAIANARENATINQLPLDARCVSLGDEAIPAGPFDVAIANLTGAALLRFAEALLAFVPAGTLIVSGLREDEEPEVTAALTAQAAARYELDGWICLVVEVDRRPKGLRYPAPPQA